jgi:hypothetical protein
MREVVPAAEIGETIGGRCRAVAFHARASRVARQDRLLSEEDTMSTIWIWEVDVITPGVDVTGFDVDARDGHIGKVDAATYDAGTAGLVVDTGFWIFGKKRLLPAGLVDRIDVDEKKVFLACTKDEVKQAPDFDATREADPAFHEEIGGYFDPSRYRGMHGDPNGPTAGPG